MGNFDASVDLGEDGVRLFVNALLRDVRALELMPDSVFDETHRIGAEQEMFLVDASGRPAPITMDLLARIRDSRCVPELARFNLEANLTPRPFRGDALRLMEKELAEVLDRVRDEASRLGARPLLTGILPTLTLDDLTLSNLTPNPRYLALNEAVVRLRGGPSLCHIKGVDDLELVRNDIMLEAANTSFQLHYQVAPREFASVYNVAQAVTGPVLAAAVNSPMLLGRRLWHETRVAVFEQSIDARSSGQQARGHRTRVNFGDGWVHDSILEIFHEDIARFRVLLSAVVEEDSLELLAKGLVPRLQALRLHNGTVYRWNRPCYGVFDGKPHLRIEARAFPAGPTIADEMANAAFFFGLLVSLSAEHPDMSRVMSFEDAKANFVAAARRGLSAQFAWFGGRTLPAPELILEHLLPRAREGLSHVEVDAADVDRYLGIIEARVRAGQTGARWTLKSLASMGDRVPNDRKHGALVLGSLRRQEQGDPVHTWDLASETEAPDRASSYRTLGQFMTTDLFTVRPWDVVDLAACVMDWEHVRHVPVEDDQGHLMGIVSHRAVLRLVAQGQVGNGPVSIASIMKSDPVTATPRTTTLEGIALMRRHKVGCLPIVSENKLVGIVTEHDLLSMARALLEEELQADATQPAVRVCEESG